MQQVLARPADDALVAQAAAGDERAFDRVVGAHAAVGFRLAVTMLRDRAEAEDAVQEAMLKAWRALHRLRPGSNVRAWFLTIVANECRSRLRTRWRSVLRLPDLERRPDDLPETEEASIDLRRALSRLDANDRAAVFLRYYEDMTIEEVAQVSGLSVPAARSRVHRALARLRVRLEGEDA